MNGSELERTEPQDEILNTQEPAGPAAGPGINPDEIHLEPPVSAENFSAEMDRFFSLSSELQGVLSRLSHEIKSSAEQVDRMSSAIQLKKKELQSLYGFEMAVAEMERLIQERREEKENLDRAIESQRAAWEKEKSERIQEQKSYQEDLQLRREREEDEYRQKWAAERLKAQQKLEEELKVIQQEALQKQQAMERNCLERELALKQKELEWVQLIQELEQFMAKLIKRTHSQGGGSSDSAPRGELAIFGENRVQEDGLDESARSSFYFGEPSYGVGGEESGSGEDSEDVDVSKTAISSLKEMLMQQGKRIESLNAETAKKEPAPLKVLPKKPLP